MLEDGTLHIDTLNPDFTTIQPGQTYQLKQANVATGYFAVLPEANSGAGVVLFVNGQGISAVDLTGDNFEQISE